MILPFSAPENDAYMGYSCRLPPFGGESGRKGLKGIRGPDTPPVSPSAWPAQPAGLTPRRRASPPPQRHPAPCLAADRGALTARRPWAVACPCRLRRLRVPSNNSNRDGPHCGVPSLLLSARLRRIISRDTYIIYKVGWVAYRTIFRAGALKSKFPGKGQRTRPQGRIPMYYSNEYKRSPCPKSPLSPPASVYC